MNRLTVHIAETKDFSEEVIARLKAVANVRVQNVTVSELPTALDACDVFWFRLGFRLDASVLKKGIRCRFLVCPVTGLDHIDLTLCDQLGIKVISLKGETLFLQSVRATAEHSLALTLALLRNIPDAVQQTKDGVWNREPFKGREVYGKTVGIVGVGRLGKIVASYFSAMGADVVGYDTLDLSPLPGIKLLSSLHELVAVSDVISVHVSYHAGSHHLINKAVLANVKKGAVLINTARGSVVDSDDLIEALTLGQLRGAALDVIENEFDPARDKLVQFAKHCPTLILTPHIGGNTFESFFKTEMFVFNKLVEAAGLKKN